ncbi:MAG: hypothetical protein HW405_506 [Candidatus Berkelbacteria bacterium]|nr:hypothetical protein [Candidatus Berkelbacteria bacterium]
MNQNSDQSIQKEQTTNPNKSKWWWLIIAFGLVLSIIMYLRGLGIFILPVLLLIGAIIVFIVFQKNNNISEKTKTTVGTLGIFFTLGSAVFIALVNWYDYQARTTPHSGDLLGVALVWALSLIFLLLIFLTGIFLMFSYNGPSKNFQVTRFVVIIFGIALMGSSYYYSLMKIEEYNREVETQKNAILAQGMPQEEAVSIAEKELKKGSKYKLDGAREEVSNGKPVWNISFAIQNKSGNTVLTEFIDVDALTGKVIDSTTNKNFIELTLTSQKNSTVGLEVYDVTLKQDGERSQVYFLEDTADFAISNGDGKVSIVGASGEPDEYILVVVDGEVRAFPYNEGTSSLNIDFLSGIEVFATAEYF